MQRNPHSFTVQKVLACTGLVMLIGFLCGFIFLAKFIPPPSPLDSAQRTLQMYRDHAVSIRFGMLITTFVSALLIPFAAAIYAQLKRIEGDPAPLALTQLCSAAVLSLEFIITALMWQTAAYRAETDDAARLVQAINDMSWLIFVAAISCVVVQTLAIGWAILIDYRDEPVFPRWSGYFNIWAALLLSPAGIVPFFKDGPFAWNGVISFWVPLTTFTLWFFVMTYVLLTAIGRQQEVESPAADLSIAGAT